MLALAFISINQAVAGCSWAPVRDCDYCVLSGTCTSNCDKCVDYCWFCQYHCEYQCTCTPSECNQNDAHYCYGNRAVNKDYSCIGDTCRLVDGSSVSCAHGCEMISGWAACKVKTCDENECNKNDQTYCNGDEVKKKDYSCVNSDCVLVSDNGLMSCLWGCTQGYAGAVCNSEPSAYCGDGSCNNNEDCNNCPSDCGECQPREYCGDGSCNNNEDCNNCPSDCGSCQVRVYCGDGNCNNNEDCNNCPSDCGECQPREYCGDGDCGDGEDYHNCPADCQKCWVNCPAGWTCYERSCYKNLGSKSWIKGKQACEDLKSHLVTINNARENQWLDDFTSGNIWIGYNDRVTEGDWKWLHESSRYENWARDEPNNAGNEDCAEYRSNGEWNDLKCGRSLTIICEKEDGADIEPPVPDTPCSNTCTTNCPSGWACRGDSCYLKTSGSWTSVKDYCESIGAHIITVNDKCENQWVHDKGAGWIGYNDRSNEGHWAWVNGSSRYLNWYDGEPNNAGNEDCAEAWGGATWNDAKCGLHRTSFCEVENPCPNSCDDGDVCTLDQCSVNGCVNEPITPCDGNGLCESGEDYCNSIDCPAPSCGACQEVACSPEGPECTYLTNCCGNNACETGEDCISCPGDCGCALGVDLNSVNCWVNDKSCQDLDEIRTSDTITTSFNLLNATHDDDVKVRVGFSTVEQELGSKTVASERVTHSFNLPSGRQSVTVNADDLLSQESTGALLFSITIKDEDDKADSTSYPFNYEQGSSHDDSEPVNPNYAPASTMLFGGLGAAALAGLGGLALSKKYASNQGTYVPIDPDAFIKEADKAHEDSLKRRELFSSVLYGLSGVRKDGVSSTIDNVKLGISLAQLLVLLTPVNPVFGLIGGACIVIDNYVDGTELITNIGGFVHAKKQKDDSLAGEHAFNAGLAFFALFGGDIAQDGKKALKSLGIIGDVAQNTKKARIITELLALARKAGKLSNEGLNTLKKSLKSIKHLDETKGVVKRIVKEADDETLEIGESLLKKASKIANEAKLHKLWEAVSKTDLAKHGSLVKKITQDLTDDSIDFATSVIKKLDNVFYKFTVDQSIVMSKKALQKVNEIINAASNARNALGDLSFKLTLNKRVPETIKLTSLKNALGTYSDAKNVVKLDLEKLVAKTKGEVYEVVNHEFLHAITSQLREEVTKKLGSLTKKYWIGNVDVTVNEAHDLLVYQLSKMTDYVDTKIFEKAYKGRIKKYSHRIISDLTNAIKNKNTNLIQSIFRRAKTVPGLAEQAVLDNGKTTEILNTIKESIENKNVMKKASEIIGEKIKEIKELRIKYEEVMDLVK